MFVLVFVTYICGWPWSCPSSYCSLYSQTGTNLFTRPRVWRLRKISCILMPNLIQYTEMSQDSVGSLLNTTVMAPVTQSIAYVLAYAHINEHLAPSYHFLKYETGRQHFSLNLLLLRIRFLDTWRGSSLVFIRTTRTDEVSTEFNDLISRFATSLPDQWILTCRTPLPFCSRLYPIR
jgi:hypothetical protein